jgi:hypothetical protein
MAEIVPDNDPVFGGDLHQPRGGTPVADQDPVFSGGSGGTVSGSKDPGPILSRSWVSLADIGRQTTSPPPSETPIRDLARNAVAATVRGIGDLGDFIGDPSAGIRRGIGVLGGSAYDYVAPKLGLPQMSDEQRGDLYGTTAPPPQEQGPGRRVLSGAGQAIGADPYAVVPKTKVRWPRHWRPRPQQHS